MCSNIPSSPAYGVYISQLIRYARASSNYKIYRLLSSLQRRNIFRQDLGIGIKPFQEIEQGESFHSPGPVACFSDKDDVSSIDISSRVGS
jgi:succinylglutamate desuccinylase